MQLDQSVERIITEINDLDRPRCISQLRSIPQLNLDFTDDFLQGLSLEQLRHVLMAACIQAQRHLTRKAARPARTPPA